MTIFLLALLIVPYALGVRNAWRRAGRGRSITRRQVTMFALAMIVLAVAFAPPVDTMADELFSAHMAQHVLLSVVVPPLLVLGAPQFAGLWALPAGLRVRVARRFATSRIRVLWAFITAPVTAWLLHAAAIWTWHAPTLYELALRNEGVHLLEHASFAGTGVLLWWRIVHPRGERRTAYAVGIVSLFGTAMHTGVLGALFTLARHVVYPVQAAGASQWGLTALEDQQIAGLVMWVVGGLLYVVAMGVLFVKWLEPAKRRRAAHLALAATVVGAAGCSRANASPVYGGDPERGRVAIAAMGCGACHDVRGVSGAHGEVGPPLTGVARRSIIAGELANTPENMMRWIEDPPAIEPNTAMPNLGVNPQSARDIVAYLYTLR